MCNIDEIKTSVKNSEKVYFDYDIDYCTVVTDQGRFNIPQDGNLIKELEGLVNTASEYESDLIFGKDKTEQVVSLEIFDNQIYLYKVDGSIEKRPMVYWILAPIQLDQNFKKLEGNQHYKYIRTFDNVQDFKKANFYYKKRNADTFIIWNEKEAAMIYHGITMFKGLKVKDVSVLSFDIESSGLVKNNDSLVYIISNTYRDSFGNITKKLFRVDNYDDDDVAMIEDWCKWVVGVDPTVLVAHNGNGYDIPYLQHCYSERNGGTKKLPLGKNNYPVTFNKNPSKFRVDGSNSWDYHKVQVSGRHIVDSMFLSVKYDVGRSFPSWGLKPIVEYLGLVKEDRQFYDASKIRDNWSDLNEREKIVKYAEDDGDDALALYDIMAPSIFYMTQSVPKNFQIMCQSSSGAQLNAILIRAYLQEGGSIPKASEHEKIYGGISFGITGIHKNVFKIDVKSEYPSIIRKFSVYPLKKDPKMYYHKMVEYFTLKRFKQKDMYKETGDKYYDDLQASSKIFINSSYGLTSVSGLNFNDFKCGDFITGMGRQIIKESLMWATGQDITHWWEDYYTEKDLPYDGCLRSYDSYSQFAKDKKLYE